jgi:hypothetical protein
MTRQNYDLVMDAKQPEQVRLAAFANRAAWIAPLGTGYTTQINNMIHHFDHLGVVEVNPGPNDPAGKALFPPFISVEDEHRPIVDPVTAAKIRPHQKTMMSAADPTGGGAHHAPDEVFDPTGIDKLNRFPHGLRR